MISLRRAGTVLLASIVLVSAGRHATRGEDAALRAPTAAKPAEASCPRSDFRVVLDVGHTVEVPGAISAHGVTEYAFNLQLTKDVLQTLRNAGFDKTVLLLTDTKPPEGLIERAMRTNKLAADLFLSIHHDSVPDNLIKTWEYEGQQNSYNDDYPGYALFISYDNADRAGSLQFARLLGKALQARGLQYTPHYTLPIMGGHRRALIDTEAGVYRFDRLAVLRNTHTPAVLLEAGSIVNREEELQLAGAERRSLTSDAITAAVTDFCTARAIAARLTKPVSALRPAPSGCAGTRACR
jgi:N-acetylmuramoyl-L-alanine amidase